MHNSPPMRLINLVDGLNAWLSKLVSWFTLFMVILTFAIVVLRYGFNLGWVALQESVMYLHAMVFLLGCAHALRCNEHVRVDIFYRKMSAKRQAWVDIAGSLILLIPVNVFLFIACWSYVLASWQTFEGSPQAGGLPLVFILKTLLLLFTASMLLQGAAELLRNILRLRKQGEL